MKEPTRRSMSTGLPHKETIKKIPMPALNLDKQYAEGSANDVYIKEDNAGQSFWKFISDHEKSRANWLKKQNENNTEGDKT